MKIKQKGIATVVIAVIVVVVVVAAAGVGILLLTGGTGPGGISAPSGFTKTGQQEIQGYTVTAYSGTGTENDALNAFKTSFQNAGWTYKGEGSAAGFSGMSFEKGNDMAVVYAVAQGNQVVVSTIVGPKPGGASGGGDNVPSGGGPESLPSSDQTTGTEPITRYTGAIMLTHTGPTTLYGMTSTSIEYGTMDNLSTVVSWYKSSLAGAGWDLILESPEAEKTDLGYMKGTETAGITVSLPTESHAFTTIGVVYVTTPTV